jgi:hypothetical protein
VPARTFMSWPFKSVKLRQRSRRAIPFNLSRHRQCSLARCHRQAPEGPPPIVYSVLSTRYWLSNRRLMLRLFPAYSVLSARYSVLGTRYQAVPQQRNARSAPELTCRPAARLLSLTWRLGRRSFPGRARGRSGARETRPERACLVDRVPAGAARRSGRRSHKAPRPPICRPGKAA